MSRYIWILTLSILSSPLHAEFNVSKDWMWDASGQEFAYAATSTDGGRILGQYCYYNQDSCVYVVTLGITCEQGSEYPALVNSNVGAIEVQLICGHKAATDENAFFIKPFTEIDNAVRQASNIGFAIAMKSGRFKVTRFSLSGSTYAIESMRESAMNKSRSIPERSNSIGSERYL
ncbi:hypothetical protein EHN06_08915 [Marinobacter sp. NP-4(2019)]|uniref:hypothetical protein n=1 Tax=Marinobacter sp. NP-4(2019) TaxID=2488665 RepID=UPI000FC3DC5D|nr:hypothetical protein [Marinobacter sp. NP-4(2019)]AZT83650.1 hypothetical protein EHN06_08915 [Marinobacter sp. NP-4(2019)]